MIFFSDSETRESQTATYNCSLPVQDVAKLSALKELFPELSEEAIINQLIRHSLSQMEKQRQRSGGHHG